MPGSERHPQARRQQRRFLNAESFTLPQAEAGPVVVRTTADEVRVVLNTIAYCVIKVHHTFTVFTDTRVLAREFRNLRSVAIDKDTSRQIFSWRAFRVAQRICQFCFSDPNLTFGIMLLYPLSGVGLWLLRKEQIKGKMQLQKIYIEQDMVYLKYKLTNERGRG